MALLAARRSTRACGARDWRREDDAIVRDLKFADFAAAIALVNRVAAGGRGAATTTRTSSSTAGTTSG